MPPGPGTGPGARDPSPANASSRSVSRIAIVKLNEPSSSSRDTHPTTPRRHTPRPSSDPSVHRHGSSGSQRFGASSSTIGSLITNPFLNDWLPYGAVRASGLLPLPRQGNAGSGRPWFFPGTVLGSTEPGARLRLSGSNPVRCLPWATATDPWRAGPHPAALTTPAGMPRRWHCTALAGERTWTFQGRIGRPRRCREIAPAPSASPGAKPPGRCAPCRSRRGSRPEHRNVVLDHGRRATTAGIRKMPRPILQLAGWTSVKKHFGGPALQVKRKSCRPRCQSQ